MVLFSIEPVRKYYLMPACVFCLTETPVHSNVRGALRRRRQLRLQDHGSDADLSQLAHVCGLTRRMRRHRIKIYIYKKRAACNIKDSNNRNDKNK